MSNYELMVIFTPVLSEEDFKASQKKYEDSSKKMVDQPYSVTHGV